ncbi:chaperonin 10-like protein [Leptodontidium sp. 2 PMI_412]|nr:chaperonin 10-like protein [Leptodontidium sp. 2 PMI_412]
MKAIILDKIGGNFTLTENWTVPTPSKSQILVQTSFTSINPIEGIQQATGMLVKSWPIALGCDASGIVVKTGADVKNFKVGDRVFGTTRLGTSGHGTFQEFFLMDAPLTFKTPVNLSDEQAATIGSGITAYFVLLNGTNIDLEHRNSNYADEWIILIGAAGSVGQYSVQIAKLWGFKVLAFCAPTNNELVSSLGADGIINHRLPLEEQLREVQKITSGNFSRVFDSSAMATATAMAALAQISNAKDGSKYFATTNDWTTIEPKEGISIYQADVGSIGQGSEETDLNKKVASYIPILEKYLATGELKTMRYEQEEEIGFGGILKALAAFKTKKGSEAKTIARVSL